ncbi:MAG: hypothetical protein QOK29_1098 [Rhodospirillaceae bacterium]|nr:hypothetical protein [Rhodospirillaceae bacterium]
MSGDGYSGIDWPSWITAGATVVALGIAVGMPIWQQHRSDKSARQEKHLRARFLAVAIDLDLKEVRSQLAMLRVSLLSYIKAPPPGPWAPHFMNTAPITIPPILTEGIDRLPILGEPAAPSILRLSAALEAYNGNVEWELGQHFRDPASDPLEHVRRLVGFVDEIDRPLGEVLAHLELIAVPA